MNFKYDVRLRPHEKNDTLVEDLLRVQQHLKCDIKYHNSALPALFENGLNTNCDW